MNKRKSLILSSIIGLAIVAGPSIALADNYPACPNVSNHRILYAAPYDTYSWGAISNTISNRWDEVFVLIRDYDVNDQITAIARANKITKTATFSNKRKVYLHPNHQGGYFFACDYKIASKYDSQGDLVKVYSPEYGRFGVLSAKPLTRAQKLALYRQQK